MVLRAASVKPQRIPQVSHRFVKNSPKGERVEGIEPSWPAWKAGTLPLSYTRTRAAPLDGPIGWNSQPF